MYQPNQKIRIVEDKGHFGSTTPVFLLSKTAVFVENVETVFGDRAKILLDEMPPIGHREQIIEYLKIERVD